MVAGKRNLGIFWSAKWAFVLSVVATIPGCGLEGLSIKGDNQPGEDLGSIPSLPPPPPSPLSLSGELRSVADCTELESYIEEATTRELDRGIIQQMHWIAASSADDGYRSSKSSGPGDDMSSETAAPTEQDAASNASGPKEHTTTNNQVTGVEEADIVKTDGKTIYHIAKGRLHILKSWPADALQEVSGLALEGRPFELLLAEPARLVVLAYPKATAMPKPEPETLGPVVSDLAYLPNQSWDTSRLSVLVVDVAVPSEPKITQRYELKGQYVSARRIGSSVRLVVQSYADSVEGTRAHLDWPEQRDLSNAAKIAKLKSYMQENRELIAAKDLNFWLANDQFVRVAADGSRVPLFTKADCSHVRVPTTSSQLGYTHVVSIDLDAEKASDTLLLSYAQQVYASDSALYLTTPYLWWGDAKDQTDVTFIHKFDISQPAVATYLASGSVAGQVLNQFAMDEYESALRVATTISNFDPAASGFANRVSVLAHEGTSLKLIGQSPDLAPGERIYSTRFAGPRGFVVTFKQVDPLFTLDLSDPTTPKVVGELKIPGYSSYIHMLGEHHLLAVGRDGDESGRIGGLKITIFDVSDPASPREAHSQVVTRDTAWGWSGSEAEYDHRAFTYYASRQILAIPVTGSTSGGASSGAWWTRYRSTLQLFRITPEAGIAALGHVDLADMYQGREYDGSWWFDGLKVRRSIFADDVVYAVSNMGIRAASLEALNTPLATASYPCDVECYQSWWWN